MLEETSFFFHYPVVGIWERRVLEKEFGIKYQFLVKERSTFHFLLFLKLLYLLLGLVHNAVSNFCSLVSGIFIMHYAFIFLGRLVIVRHSPC